MNMMQTIVVLLLSMFYGGCWGFALCSKYESPRASEGATIWIWTNIIAIPFTLAMLAILAFNP